MTQPPDQPEPNLLEYRSSLGDAFIGVFMSFTVLAIWLLALAVF